jgi:hypothetical protein
MPGEGDAVDLLPSAPTAKTLSERAVFVEEHFGHSTGSRLDIDLISRSNLAWHDPQVYS